MARILVLDDMHSTCELVAEMLSQDHHLVRIAASVAEARYVLASEPVEILITDIYMPEEDGLQLIGYVRKHHPAVIVVAMSSKTGPWDMLGPARFLGAAFTLYKPFSAEQLRSLVNQGLARGSAEAGGIVQ